MRQAPHDPDPAPCLHCLAGRGLLDAPLRALDDREGAALPQGLPPVIDAHVHVFPPPIFAALWRWFDRYGWPVRYRLEAEAVLDFLLSRGVARIVACQYPHRPGLARALNAWLAALVADRPAVAGLASVYPSEADAPAALEEAFAAGLVGVKLHCHVQSFSVDDPALHGIYEVCARWDRPLLIHAGREPRSPAYPVDPYALCGAERIDRVLRDHPRLRLCVPHLGADEFGAYEALLERHDGLWLDTTMAVAGFLPLGSEAERAAWRLVAARPDRLLYGTDFPNLPYAWDRELRRLLERGGLGEEALAGLLGGNAARLYGL